MVEQEGGAEIPNPRVLAQTKTNRPLVSPDTYSGDRNWTDWVEHFEAAALVNGWDEPTKLLWLPVRLTGKAQTAWRRLAPEAKQDFQAAKDALQKRFEPESKRQLYVVEFQTRKRRPDEQWSDFGDELRILADKAFPGIDEKAKDLLSLERYLSELDNPKVAFAVRQRQPKTLDDAVSCTMEMESYLHQETKGSKISVVSDVPVEERETLMAMIHSLSERMGKLETSERPAQARAVWQGRTLCQGLRGWLAEAEAEKLDTLYAKDQAYGEFMLDTGAAVSLVRKDVWDRLGGASRFGLSPWRGRHLVGVEGSTVPVCGVTTLDFHLADQAFSVDLVVVDSLKVESILGLDFLEKHHGIIDLSKMVLQLEGVSIQLQHHADSSNSSDMLANEVSVSLIETVKIPAYSEIQTMAYTSSTCKGVWLVEGSRPDIPIIVAGAVVTPSIGEPLGSIPVLMCNPLPTETVVHKGTRIARATRLQDESLLAPVTDAMSQEKKIPKVSESKSKLLWEMVQNCAADLSKEEMEMLYHVLMAYADVFAESNDELGRTNMVKQSVDTGNNPPIRQQFRRMPPFRREQARKLIEDMLKREIVQPSSSPWASPVVIATKKDGSLRFCVDYRKLNSITRKDAYPLPRIDDSLDALNGSKWFSTLDLICGYWQVEMDENDRQKTAFCTQEGLFEFKVMPFGLCNAPATFQRLMDLVLSGIQWKSCLVYIDDIVIVVQNWKMPNSIQDVRQFLGLVGYYRKYIPHFAAIARPLHQLTERGREFQWTQECIHAFDELKSRLLSAPILSFPDFEKPFILDTDACQYGIGAVLSQDHDGEEKVVAYGSRTLSKAERKYCVTRKELLAVVTFTKHFRPYLLGRHFTLRTDHSSLQWLYNMKEPEGQLARWFRAAPRMKMKPTSRVVPAAKAWAYQLFSHSGFRQELGMRRACASCSWRMKMWGLCSGQFSIPQQLHSDQGRQFESDVMKEVCKLLQISKTRTTPYHPQSDGLVERFNRFSPFFLMFGRQAKLPVDLVYGSTPTEPQPQHEYARQLQKILQGAFQAARDNMGTATERMKEVYNQRVHGKQYEPGDLVWLHTPVVPKGKPRKLHCPWTGPFRVVKRLSAVTYRILDLRRIAARRRKRMVVHFDRLKPCPSDIRLDLDDVDAKNPEAEGPTSTNQSHHRPEYPGTTLQFFDDSDDLEIAEQEIVQQPACGQRVLEVHGHEDVQAGVATPQDEQPAADQPLPRRYPQRIRHPPDRY
eukprot:Em0002g1133a